MLQKIEERLNNVSKEIHKREGQRDLLTKEKENLEINILTYQKDYITYTQVRQLFEILIKGTERNIKLYIEPIITEALDFVFSQNLRFHLLFVNRRSQTEIDFIVLPTDEMEKDYLKYAEKFKEFEKELEELVKETKNINFSFGGAVNQVISLILRFVMAELLQLKGPIILDEPTSAVGENYALRLGQLISSLSKRFNRQYIFITHSKALASFAEKKYSVEQINNKSVITLEE